MVLVTVVMACWAKAKSASLRLFLAMRMFRRFAKVPKPFRSCCDKPTTSAEETSGLKKLNAEPEDERRLFHAIVRFVPVVNPCETLLLNCEVWVTSDAAVAEVPTPEMNGLLMGDLLSSKEICEVNVGSKLRNGILALEKRTAAPGMPFGKPPASAVRISVSAIHG